MTLRTYILLIILLGLLLFARGLTNGFVGDDQLQILQNIKVHSVANIPSFFAGSTYETAGGSAITGIFYRPVMLTVFSVLYSFAGPNPILFHFTQVALHVAVAVFIFLFLRKFFPDIGAFLLSLIFLVHPANSEAVLYSANLQEVLFLFFGMLALLLVQKKDKSTLQMWLIPVFVLLSLFSKESGILFLIIIPIYSWIFDRRQLPFLLNNLPKVFLLYLAFRYGIAHMYMANTSLAPIANLPLSQRLMHIPIITLYYIKLFFYPMDLKTYQHWTIQTISLFNFWMPLLIDILFFALLTSWYRWIDNAAQKKAYLFFLVWFGLGLILHIQIIPLDVTVADRWFYFPIIGLLGIVGLLCLQLLKQIKVNKSAGIMVVTVIIVLLSARTFIRISDWQNELTLFGYDIQGQSNFILANSYGAALIQDGQYEKAKPYVLMSVKEHPFTANINNLAIIYVSEGNISKAKEYFKKAMDIGQTYSLYENYANFLLYYDSPKSALDFTQKALAVYPESAKLWLVQAEAEYLSGDRENALKAAARSYQIEPNDKTLDIFTTIKDGKELDLKKR